MSLVSVIVCTSLPSIIARIMISNRSFITYLLFCHYLWIYEMAITNFGCIGKIQWVPWNSIERSFTVSSNSRWRWEFEWSSSNHDVPCCQLLRPNDGWAKQWCFCAYTDSQVGKMLLRVQDGLLWVSYQIIEWIAIPTHRVPRLPLQGGSMQIFYTSWVWPHHPSAYQRWQNSTTT